MKRFLIIGGASLLIFVLGGVWVYMLVVGTPRSVDEVIPFDFGRSTDILPDTNQGTSSEPTTAGSDEPRLSLRQLSTRAVAGFGDVLFTPSSTPLVYLVEAGSGHIYRLDDRSGQEERLSGITIPESVQADVSRDGRYAVILAGYGSSQTGTVLSLGTSSRTVPSTFTLEGSVGQLSITSRNELLYTVRSDSGTTFMSRALAGGSSKTLFSVPFRSALVSWGDTANGPHYVYPRPSYLLEGYVYRWLSGKLERLPVEGYGLVAWGSGDTLVYSKTVGEGYESYVHDVKSRNTTVLPFVMLPEKCGTGVATSTLWCASPTTLPGFGFPDSWYRGDESLSDVIVRFENNADFQSTDYMVTPSTEAGRLVDIDELKAGATPDRVMFTNKIDNTLWLYERP